MEGYSGSDIKLVCREAAMRPVRKIFNALENQQSGMVRMTAKVLWERNLFLKIGLSPAGGTLPLFSVACYTGTHSLVKNPPSAPNSFLLCCSVSDQLCPQMINSLGLGLLLPWHTMLGWIHLWHYINIK